MDPKSGDPTLGSTLIEDDLALDGFLSDIIDKDVSSENLGKKCSHIFFSRRSHDCTVKPVMYLTMKNWTISPIFSTSKNPSKRLR